MRILEVKGRRRKEAEIEIERSGLLHLLHAIDQTVHDSKLVHGIWGATLAPLTKEM